MARVENTFSPETVLNATQKYVKLYLVLAHTHSCIGGTALTRHHYTELGP